MKAVVIFAALVAVALAAPPPARFASKNNAVDVVVVKQVLSDSDSLKTPYHHAYELSNGQFHEETGEIVKGQRESRSGEENDVVRVRGSYGWVDAVTGQKYVVNYVADENGFQPQSANVPVA